MNTYYSIKEDLKNLGIREGDTIFLRISYKSIGEIEGGPKTFLDAIIDILGKEGTIILTAFPARYNNKLRFLYQRYSIDKGHYALPITGVMSKIAMNYPKSYISAREDFPFVVIGKHAEYLTTNHTYDKEGYWVLEEAIKQFGCICLRVGGDPYIGTTHMALSHILREKGEYQQAPRYGIYVKDNGKLKWIENNNVIFCLSALKQYLPRILDLITINSGKVGNGYAIITNMKKSMLAEENLFREDIKNILCSNPDCCICRTTFSFSKEKKMHFLFRQLQKSFIKNKNEYQMYSNLKNILIRYMLFTTKND